MFGITVINILFFLIGGVAFYHDEQYVLAFVLIFISMIFMAILIGDMRQARARKRVRR